MLNQLIKESIFNMQISKLNKKKSHQEYIKIEKIVSDKLDQFFLIQKDWYDFLKSNSNDKNDHILNVLNTVDSMAIVLFNRAMLNYIGKNF